MALGKLPDDDASDEEAIFAEINITPLTDIFLVMLIIFMVSSTVAADEKVEQAEAEKSRGMQVNLPSGAAQEISSEGTKLVVGIMADGEILVNGQAVDEARLDELFRRAYVRDKQTQVVLNADRGVTHGRVVGVMERAKQVGLSRLAIGTRGGG